MFPVQFRDGILPHIRGYSDSWQGDDMAKAKGIWWTGLAPRSLADAERGRWDGLSGAVRSLDECEDGSAYCEGAKLGIAQRQAAHERLDQTCQRIADMVRAWAQAPSFMGERVEEPAVAG